MTEVDLTISVGRKEPSPLRLVFTLALAAFCSGFVLSGVYQLTKPRIDQNKAERLRAGVLLVVPGSTQIRKFALRHDELVPVGPDEVTTEPVIHGACDDQGRFVGWAITDAAPGFQDTIRVLYGFDPARRLVTGMYILESRETPGLGDKIMKDDSFVNCFRDLAVSPDVVAVKTGRTQDHEVDAISGATISSVAVVRIINEANARWLERLPEPAGAPGAAGAGGSGE